MALAPFNPPFRINPDGSFPSFYKNYPAQAGFVTPPSADPATRVATIARLMAGQQPDPRSRFEGTPFGPGVPQPVGTFPPVSRVGAYSSPPDPRYLGPPLRQPPPTNWFGPANRPPWLPRLLEWMANA